MYLQKLFLFSFLGVLDMPVTERMFSLLGGSPLSKSELVKQRARGRLHLKGNWKHPFIRPGAQRLLSPPVWHHLPLRQLPDFSPLWLQFPSRLSLRIPSVVLMTHYVVCSGAQLRFPEGKQQTKSNTPNSFSPCSANLAPS